MIAVFYFSGPNMNKGILSAFLAYVCWGIFPVYFKLLHSVPPLQTMTHRVVWSFLFLILILVIRKEVGPFWKEINLKRFLIYLGAGTLLAINWLTYVWAIANGFVIESSLGYFINPLVSVLLGVIFLGERLRPVQWIPVGLAVIGVSYLTISYGSLPWIALVLAFSFGFYGLVKKIAPLGSLFGLTLETGAIFIPAFIILLVAELNGTGVYGHTSTLTTILLSLTGVVTAVPLLLFATGARSVPLTMIGLLQYIAPTLQFISGIVIFHEPFNSSRLVGFGIIWLALIIFTVENLTERRRLYLAVGK
jgi:chloramphenicol-sensitive protein RarD